MAINLPVGAENLSVGELSVPSGQVVMLSFAASENDFSQQIYTPRLILATRLNRADIRGLFRARLKAGIPANNCQNRYHDHEDYTVSLSGNSILGANTVTYERWQCINVMIDEIKTRVFKTTVHQNFDVAASFDPAGGTLALNGRVYGDYVTPQSSSYAVPVESQYDIYWRHDIMDATDTVDATLTDALEWDALELSDLALREAAGQIYLSVSADVVWPQRAGKACAFYDAMLALPTTGTIRRDADINTILGD